MSFSRKLLNITKGGFVLYPSGGIRKIITHTVLKAPGRADRICKVTVTFPCQLLERLNGKEFLTNENLYGQVSDCIARRVFSRSWPERSFGIIPGNFYYSVGDLYFDGVLHPISEEAPNSLLFYADVPMMGFAGLNGATTFQFGESEWHALILPIDGTIYGCSVSEIRKKMEESLQNSLAS